MNYAETDDEDMVTVKAPKAKKRRKQNGKDHRTYILIKIANFYAFLNVILQTFCGRFCGKKLLFTLHGCHLIGLIDHE